MINSELDNYIMTNEINKHINEQFIDINKKIRDINNDILNLKNNISQYVLNVTDKIYLNKLNLFETDLNNITNEYLKKNLNNDKYHIINKYYYDSIETKFNNMLLNNEKKIIEHNKKLLID